ncbi:MULTISPECIES: hypothetical protein [Selenomonas]|nr:MULTISPECIES: hypothetical protein [Selenomonas]
MRFDKCISWGKEAALGNDQFENKQAYSVFFDFVDDIGQSNG